MTDTEFKGTVGNRELPSLYGESLEITLKVPLINSFPPFNVD